MQVSTSHPGPGFRRLWRQDELELQRFAALDARLVTRLERLSAGKREIRFTHAELAEQVGASRENVSRALRRLELAGALRCHRGRIEILDLSRAAPERGAIRSSP